MEISGVRKSFLVFTFPAGRGLLSRDRARNVWSALNSLLKIDLPALFPVALIEGKNQKKTDLIIVEAADFPIFQKKLGRIQILKGRLPDGCLERIKSGINNFSEESYMKENWFIIGCKTNSAKESFFLSPGKVPV